MQIIREITKKAPYYLTHLIAFTLPLSAKLVSLFVILFFISVLFAGNYQKGFLKTIKLIFIHSRNEPLKNQSSICRLFCTVFIL